MDLQSKYKDFEKRVKFNENIINVEKQTIDNLNENINILSNSVTILDNTVNALQDSEQTQNQALTDLSIELTNISENIDQHTQAINSNTILLDEHTNILDNVLVDLDDVENTIVNFDDILEEHSNRIEINEVALDNYNVILEKLRNQYGTSVTDIANSANSCAFEPVYYFGGQNKFNVGSKASFGPFATLFTRVSPLSQFSGVIRLYMSEIPEIVTQTTLNFYINSHLTQLTVNIIEEQAYNIELSFDFLALTTSNVFKIEFSDSLLENTILDFIEIISSNGRNFMCLNRCTKYGVSTFINDTGRISYIYARQISNVGDYVELFFERTSPPYSKVCQIPGYGTPLNINIMHNHLRKRVSVGFYDSTIIQLSVAGENSTLYGARNNNSEYLQYFSGVYSAFICYHWRKMSKCYCGTTLNQQVFIGDETTLSIDDIPTINSVQLPNEFITCTPIEDLRFMLRGVNKEIGYILLHNSGKIFYIQEDDGTYFIEIGLGSQPNAYMQSDYETIYIYYTFNKITYRKELKFNCNTNKWELTKSIEIYPATIEIIEFYDGCQVRTALDGTRQIFKI
ncbi:MAG: hypothetical protein PHX09_00660 [Clostridia bacterium]|nr:hypothetical protein [Clostridia bacterium]MDD4685882.1 hypothetical protein [Clostridia bacterium]